MMKLEHPLILPIWRWLCPMVWDWVWHDHEIWSINMQLYFSLGYTFTNVALLNVVTVVSHFEATVSFHGTVCFSEVHITVSNTYWLEVQLLEYFLMPPRQIMVVGGVNQKAAKITSQVDHYVVLGVNC
jgi:hypothetical protein